jgi:hypothetical protein
MPLLLEDSAPVVHTQYWRTLRCGYRGPGCVSSQGLRIRQAGLTCGEILPACGYWDGGRDWCGLLTGPVLFRLVVPPLQPEVMGPYPVQGTWFPSRLSLEGIASYLDFLDHNRWLAILGVQNPDTSCCGSMVRVADFGLFNAVSKPFSFFFLVSPKIVMGNL